MTSTHPFQTLKFIAFFLAIGFGLVLMVEGGAKLHDESCEEAKNVTTVTASNTSTTDFIPDSCNATAFLTCRNLRCGCKDPAFQIYSKKEYKTIINIRSKRSKKKGVKGSTIAKAAVVGGIAGVGTYQVNKYLDANSNSGSTFSISSPKKSQILKSTKYSCYTRVGGNCAINPDHVRQITRIETINGTTVNHTIVVDYKKDLSECVWNAECKSKPVSKPEDDLNIGVCVCKLGYINSKTDTCVKVSSGGKILSSNFATTFIVFLTVAISHSI